MAKFILFFMIGYKLKMDNWYWGILHTYMLLWIIGKVMGWL